MKPTGSAHRSLTTTSPAVLRSLAAMGALLFASGLGCSTRSAVSYAGEVGGELVHPEQVEELTAMPPDYQRLGSADARCRIVWQQEFTPEWLSDVDCSEARLTRALTERAADVGGSALVEKHCYTAGGSRPEIVCQADIARTGVDDARVHYPSTPSASPRSSEAWSIRVKYTRERDERRPARPAHNVGELAEQPVSHVRLGSIVTTCKAGCTEGGARGGLLAVAGRVGADAVVRGDCVRQADGWICTGVATGYEVDPRLDRSAR